MCTVTQTKISQKKKILSGLRNNCSYDFLGIAGIFHTPRRVSWICLSLDSRSLVPQSVVMRVPALRCWYFSCYQYLFFHIPYLGIKDLFSYKRGEFKHEMQSRILPFWWINEPYSIRQKATLNYQHLLLKAFIRKMKIIAKNLLKISLNVYIILYVFPFSIKVMSYITFTSLYTPVLCFKIKHSD